MDKSKNTSWSVSFSVMRIAAAIAVILLHTCSTLCENRDVFAMTDFQAAVLGTVTGLMRWSVPVFFMLTGSLLLNPQKEITYRNGVFRYVKRIFLALLIFGIPFAMMKGYMENHGFTPGLIVQSVLAVLQNQSLSHLWYLYELIGIYLVLPLIKPFVWDGSDKEIRTALILLGIFDFAVPAISMITGMTIAFHIPLQYSLFYILAGWYLRMHGQEYSSSALLAVSAVCIAVICVLSFGGSAVWLCASYDSPLTACLALCIFCLFMKADMHISEKKKSLLWEADRLCFAVYLIHPVFIQFTYRFLKITPLVSESLWPALIPVFWLLFTVLAFAGAWILRKIPILKNNIL